MRVSPNRPLLLMTQAVLGEELREFVLVGGAVVDLLITDPNAPEARGTEDVDLLIEVATRLDLYAVERRLGARGLVHPMVSGEPICRWQKGGLTLDVMPTDPELYGFGNRWAREAVESAFEYQDDELTIRHVSAPAFIALKVEAFRSPGRRNGGDVHASHDLGDILAVLDGRPSVVEEVRTCAPEMRGEIALFVRELGERHDYEEFAESHILDRGRIERVAETLRTLAGLS